jgi:4-hydroxy-2-oxoheptanedioate aldolase
VSAYTGLRARLHEPGPLYWAMMLIPEPAIASIFGLSGLDFVVLDAEHGPFTLSSIRACSEALRVTSTPVVVRPPSSDVVHVKQLLDAGVDGLLMPGITSAGEVQGIVKAARYAPEGNRCISTAVRAADYGKGAEPYHEFLQQAHARVAVIPIVESAEAVAQIDEIVAVPGVDGIQIGPNDLSSDLGLVGDFGNPTVVEAIDRVTRATLAAGLKIGAGTMGTVAHGPESMLIGCYVDALGLTSGIRDALAAARDSGQ